MSRSKLLLLTLGISSAIHLVLAATYLWLEQSPGTPSAHAVVEISLQQTVPAQPTTPPEQQPDPPSYEKVLSTLQTTDQPLVLADADTPPNSQPAERIEAEAEPAPRIREPQSEDRLAETPAADPIIAPSVASSQTARSGQQKAEHSAELEVEKQNYLGLVAEHINSYKYYPRSAIRRGTEGEVEVSFDLQVDGSIKNLRTRGEHSVLLNASQRSIEQALPMPQRSENLLALGSIHIEFSMKYFLHQQ